MFYSNSFNYAIKAFGSDKTKGLSKPQLEANYVKYGKNVLSKKKKATFISKVFSALKEPMLLILIFSFLIAFGTSIGKLFKTGEKDFTEWLGILLAIILSVSITLIMEGSSERAFEALNKLYDNYSVKVIRGGETIVVNQNFLSVGDIVLLESGDKIVADGRLIESDSLTVDESALTGESVSSLKNANVVFPLNTPLAERRNCVYSGTFVRSGYGKMVITAIGDNTEIGGIANELKLVNETKSPLQQKLASLGKTITAIGAIASVFVFILQLIKLGINGGINFESVQELFISCIVLIVAAVPEGLPTIVAVSLALNMIKLAKENALIKKMIATETAGAVSVICSDKTGTLTKNKMEVMGVCSGEYCSMKGKTQNEHLLNNFAINSTAEILKNGKPSGSGTECALLDCYNNSLNSDYKSLRKSTIIEYRLPFSSENKYMITGVKIKNGIRLYLKGAPEKVLEMCNISNGAKEKTCSEIERQQKKSFRIVCFAHKDVGENFDCKNLADTHSGYRFDGFTLLADPIREEVYEAVNDCKKAGIKIKILTGDNKNTAFAIAKKLKIADSESQVINAVDLENLSDGEFKKALQKISVIARSTPIVKLRVVRALKELNEVVAVTGDGINDAPAIKHADIGISMGKSGSEITKEASDVILLDDSFATVVKAISFGRNVYKNLQRFIIFQLSVNLSALLFITVCAITNLETPFNTLQLLWINIIMDGPPALTLGLESGGKKIMELSPVKKSQNIVSAKMLIRIIFNGVFIGTVCYLQYLTNFLKTEKWETKSVIFTLFILFQLFNAFNCKGLNSESIFKNLTKNKIMLYTFSATFIIHLIIVKVAYPVFGMGEISWLSLLKCIGLSFSIIVISELYKGVYRKIKLKGKIR